MENNESAFPLSTIDGFTQHGMTIRDWFAGMALHNPTISIPVVLTHPKLVAEKAYEIADAMMEARK